jgi:hypothetical protein
MNNFHGFVSDLGKVSGVATMKTSNIRETFNASSTRRRTERIRIGGASCFASWLSSGRRIIQKGVLVDVSSGGFAARMFEAPPSGRLAHTKLTLDVLDQSADSIVADVRVCGRSLQGSGAGTDPDWTVNFAIESIQPADKNLMLATLEKIKVKRS